MFYSKTLLFCLKTLFFFWNSSFFSKISRCFWKYVSLPIMFFVMLHSECFIGVIWPHLRQMCPFMDWIFIFHLFILVVLFIFRWLSLFICSVVFSYLVFFAVVGVLLLGIPLKRYVIDRIELFKKRIASIYDCRSRSLYDKFWQAVS